MTDTAFPLQEAAFAAIAGDPTVQSLLGNPVRFYDVAPESPTFPFAVFGDWKTSAYAGLPGAFEHDIRIRIFSRYGGRKETRQIMSALHDVLHDAPLSAPGHRLVSMRFVFSDVFLRADRGSWDGIMRFRAVDEVLAE